MLRYYFDRCAVEVRTPIKDSTGQSIHVDEYLGKANSLPRMIASDYFGRISRRMALADDSWSVSYWKSLIEGWGYERLLLRD